MHLFCFGLGYAAKHIANKLSPSWKISGTHTSPDNLKENEYVFNDEICFDLHVLDNVTHILISIPPNEQGDPVYLKLADYFKGLKKLQWIGYFSSSSVYGDHQGKWVDEESATKPFESLGQNRLLAEGQWLNSSLPINILRLTGIYGPGRSAIETIKADRAMRILKEGHYFSRVHIEDLANMTIKIMDKPKLYEIYNIADDYPAPNHKIIEYACKLMNIDPPELINFAEANLSEAMQNYYLANKKVSNQKIKDDYKIELVFPSFKEGYKDIVRVT